MDKTKSLYQIFKYDFHKAPERTIQAEADGVDGAKYVNQAQTCFASLFDQNTIDKLASAHRNRPFCVLLSKFINSPATPESFGMAGDFHF